MLKYKLQLRSSVLYLLTVQSYIAVHDVYKCLSKTLSILNTVRMLEEEMTYCASILLFARTEIYFALGKNGGQWLRQ